MKTKIETKHTPGPWTIGKRNYNEHTCINLLPVYSDNGAGNVCGCYGSCLTDSDSNPMNQKQAANAQLIASAPELLAALQAVSRLDYLNEHNALAEMVRAAIAKATGKE